MILIHILGAIFQMWKVTRQRQMAQFTNMDAGREQGIEGHGAHSVTPEQVILITFFFKKKGKFFYFLRICPNFRF